MTRGEEGERGGLDVDRGRKVCGARGTRYYYRGLGCFCHKGGSCRLRKRPRAFNMGANDILSVHKVRVCPTVGILLAVVGGGSKKGVWASVSRVGRGRHLCNPVSKMKMFLGESTTLNPNWKSSHLRRSLSLSPRRCDTHKKTAQILRKARSLDAALL